MPNEYILIAEDDEDDQYLLMCAFKEMNDSPELIFVENGIELLNYFKKFENGEIANLPSLLIVDLNMPKKNGKEALEELYKKNYFQEFRTVIFSTTGNEYEKKRCSDLGVANFFVKPSSYPALLTLVNQFTQLASAF